MKLKKKDVIVSSVEGSLDKVALVSEDADNLLGSTGFFVLREKKLRPEVLLALLKISPFQALLKREAQGTILTSIPKSSLKRILLPKLNVALQGKLAKDIQRSHTLNREAKALLKKAKQAVEIFIEQDERAALKFIQAA